MAKAKAKRPRPFSNAERAAITAAIEADHAATIEAELAAENKGGEAPLQFHPLANIFPLMEDAEFDELVADIKANGQHARIVLKDGMILDGRNRYRACRKLGIEPSFACKAYSDQITDPAAYVISANIHRRHLKPEEKEPLIAKLLAADPGKSDRQVAKIVKASPTYVGKVRAKKEATGDVSTVDTRTDTKGRKQPAKKAKRKPSTSHAVALVTPDDEAVDDEPALAPVRSPVTGSRSWRLLVTDETGKVWSSGIRLAARDEAARYMAIAAWDFRNQEASIVEIRVVASSDASNVHYQRHKQGPHKGRIGDKGKLIFQDGTCHLFGWDEHEHITTSNDPETSADDINARLAAAQTKIFADAVGSDPVETCPTCNGDGRVEVEPTTAVTGEQEVVTGEQEVTKPLAPNDPGPLPHFLDRTKKAVIKAVTS
jgi:ParB-like chromosome segregation protein Spo0J